MRLKKNLGQHLLKDEGVLSQIINAANISDTDHIVEIGPGTGILTKELLKKARKITAIEIDNDCIPILNALTAKNNLNIIHANALHVPFPKTSYKIIANIPYHITSPLLRHAFIESRPPSSLTLLIQKEVAEKICDKENAGRLTILVGLFGKPKLIASVPPCAFIPPPKVHSAIIHIQSHAQPRVDKDTFEHIFQLTHIAFGSKRKMLRNTIGQLPDGMRILERLGISPTRRPQTLSVEEWIALVRHRSMLG